MQNLMVFSQLVFKKWGGTWICKSCKWGSYVERSRQNQEIRPDRREFRKDPKMGGK